jgi:hypothetical protein
MATVTSMAPPVAASPPPGRPQVEVHEAVEAAWTGGADDTRRRDAHWLLLDGLKFLRDARPVEAMTAFERAVTAWDSPLLNFKMAQALTEHGHFVEALTHAWGAMRHAGAGLMFHRVTTLRELTDYLLRFELGHLIVVLPDASTLSVEGKSVFVGPGRWEGVVLPGDRKLTLSLGKTRRMQALSAAAGQRIEVTWQRRPHNSLALTSKVSQRPAEASDRPSLMRSLIGTEVRFPSRDEHLPIFMRERHLERSAYRRATEDICRSPMTPELTNACDRLALSIDSLWLDITETEFLRLFILARVTEITNAPKVDVLD